jgi:2Fe-2S ferredoxin
MVTVRFLTRDGAAHDVTVPEGRSAMLAAVGADVPGIIGECGGVMSCATCHVHVPEAWRQRVGPPGEHERAVLDFAEDVTEASRLACQIELRHELDGLTLTIP